jgi:hypothetical protein
MKTAVEWLVANLDIDLVDSDWYIKKAKEIEKQQIEMAFRKGFITEQWDKTKENKSKQYYNEIFKDKL